MVIKIDGHAHFLKYVGVQWKYVSVVNQS